VNPVINKRKRSKIVLSRAVGTLLVSCLANANAFCSAEDRVAPGFTYDQTLIALKKKAAAGPVKQIFELSKREETSTCLGASGVAAYVVSASGSNRGLLLRTVNAGWAANMGMQPGDVLFSINSRVVQTGSDADRILESGEGGPARVVFVHPTEQGLQLYNAQFNLPKFASSHTSSSSFSGANSSGSTSTSGSGSSAANNSRGKQTESVPALESYMVELINHDRTSNGSPSIPANGALTALARGHAKDMAVRNFFNHVNPDGVDPQGRANSAGIRGGVYENIAFQNSFDTGTRQVQESESAMMREPKNQQNHRSNILDPGHACVGVGVVRTADGKLYMVQEFSHTSP
jgi:uncharacterized protein YkwD